MQTNQSRGRLEIDFLSRKAMPSIEETCSVLIVGVGIDNDPIRCPYLPYNIGAYLEAEGIDYEMTIVDVDSKPLADLRTRQKLYVPNHNLSVGPKSRRFWEDYLARTGQEDEVLHEMEKGLMFYDYIDNGGLVSSKAYLESGIHTAQIPRSFREKLHNGGISLLEADIARAPLADAKFEFVSCSNVLYLIPSDGQKMAMVNMSAHLASGGRMVVNDLGYVGTPLLMRQGGWLDEGKLADLGLAVEEVLAETSSSQTVALRKC